ncbi:NADH:flavin oxidoreductase [Thalassospira sp. MA62]|nr:NADH:flavin oxidoreductase [Thalassospira sp. MA62]
MSNTDILFQPFRLKTLELPNRIVMAPMTRSFTDDGVPGAANAEYYRKRAEGGVGLILSEGTVVDRPASRNDPGIPKFYGDAALAGWRTVADTVHKQGGKMGPQLWHTGSTRSFLTDWVPDAPVESPSGLVGPDDPRGNTMTESDIADTIAAFAKAALDAKNAGFDTFEIHGAHGYLIDQFFWPGTNLRTDRFGGKTITERATFAREVVAAMRAAVGPDFPIILRVSQWKQQDYKARVAYTPDEMTEWLAPLVDAGVDIIHASQRRFWEPEFPEIDGEHGLNFAGWAKKLTGAATISVGSVSLSSDFLGAFGGESSQKASIDGLIDRMERNEFDLIAVGRALITDPKWPAKVKNGAFDEIQDFDASALAELV